VLELVNAREKLTSAVERYKKEHNNLIAQDVEDKVGV
jgi:hypothetical protein